MINPNSLFKKKKYQNLYCYSKFSQVVNRSVWLYQFILSVYKLPNSKYMSGFTTTKG